MCERTLNGASPQVEYNFLLYAKSVRTREKMKEEKESDYAVRKGN